MEHRKQDTELRQSKQKTQHRQSKISNAYGHLQKPRVKLGVCERLEVLFRMRSSRENAKKKQSKKGNNYLQNIHIKQKSSNSNITENRGELRCSGRVGSSRSYSACDAFLE